jgi:two-component system, sensor histidine kinase
MQTHLSIDAAIYAEFVELMPPERVQEQLHALLDAQHSDIHALALLLTENTAQASRSAHRLKGTCMIMGFTAMSDVLFAIEKAAKHQQEADVHALMAQLRLKVDATRQALTALVPVA